MSYVKLIQKVANAVIDSTSTQSLKSKIPNQKYDHLVRALPAAPQKKGKLRQLAAFAVKLTSRENPTFL